MCQLSNNNYSFLLITVNYLQLSYFIEHTVESRVYTVLRGEWRRPVTIDQYIDDVAPNCCQYIDPLFTP